MPVAPDGMTDVGTVDERVEIFRDYGHNPKRVPIKHPDVPEETPQAMYLCETCAGIAMLVPISVGQGMRYAAPITSTLVRACESLIWLETEIPDPVAMAERIAGDLEDM